MDLEDILAMYYLVFLWNIDEREDYSPGDMAVHTHITKNHKAYAYRKTYCLFWIPAGNPLTNVKIPVGDKMTKLFKNW